MSAVESPIPFGSLLPDNDECDERCERLAIELLALLRCIPVADVLPVWMTVAELFARQTDDPAGVLGMLLHVLGLAKRALDAEPRRVPS